MLATILATALAASGTPDWPERINLEPSHALLASTQGVAAAPTARDSLRLPRIGLEVLAGSASAAILGIGGAFGAFLFGHSSGNLDTAMLVGGAIGAGVGTFMGVLFSGLLLQGDGSIVWTLVGDLAGVLVAVLTYSSLSVLPFVAFPVLGAVLAFELSGPVNVPAVAERHDGAGAVPCLAPVLAHF